MAEKLKVYHFPIVHTNYEARIDGVLKQFWNQQGVGLDTRPYWQQIKDYLETQGINYRQTKLYQDSHPVEAEEIYGDGVDALNIMNTGPNQELLAELIRRGARLKGTESNELLAETYRHREAMLKPVDRDDLIGEFVRVKKHSDAMIALTPLRDRAIAKRIRQTLGPSETGILFLGRAHNIRPYAKGINFITPPHIIALARDIDSRR